MLSHLVDLRKRALFVILFFFALFILSLFYSNALFQAFIKPLFEVFTNQKPFIAIHLTTPVLTPIKIAANTAFLGTTPFALWHLWRFISPGLYRNERHQLKNALFTSLFLFVSGVIFCYFLVLPLMFQIFVKATPFGVRLMPDIADALDFITGLLLIFGLCFQIPIISLILVRLNWIKLAELKKIRPYFTVLAFIIGMFLAPDVLSQIMLALPLCLLYELGIILARVFK